jgi:branched-chain amino acid transport system substrate-binding protein
VKTVLGDLALDAKGDVKDAKYVWYKFANGNYAEDPTIQ